jgi:beta-xylosidase
VVARSKELRHGWEQLSEPILQGGEVWRCPGHGTIVTLADGRFYYLYHAYNAVDFEYVGRQALLDELSWNNETAWPYFKHGNTPSVKAEVPFPGTIQVRDTVRTDYFSAEHLAIREWDILFPKAEMHLENGHLSMTSMHVGYSFIGFRPETGNYSFEAEVIPGEGTGGIGIYAHQNKMLVMSASHTEVQVYSLNEGEKKLLAESCMEDAENIRVKYSVRDGKFLQFSWSADGTQWNPILINGEPEFDATYLATWGYSPRAGLINSGLGSNTAYGDIEIKYQF